MPEIKNNSRNKNNFNYDIRVKSLRQHASELQKAKTIEDFLRVCPAIVRDITDFIEIHQSVIKSEARWQSLIEMVPDGIVTMNLKGFITSVNKSFLMLTGFSEDEIVGRHFTKIGTVRARDLPHYLKIFASVIRGKTSGPFDMVYKRKDGSTGHGEIHVKTVDVWEKEKEVLVITRDITQRKKDEEALLKNMKELELINRELEDFTYAVSHDLKAPLRSIESFSSFLLEDYSDTLDDTGRDYLNRMRDSTFRMKNLIDDLLLLSRIGRRFTKTEYVDFNILIKEVKLDFESTIKEIKGKIFLDKLPTIKTQKVWVRQLFANLISNGLKFNKSKEPKVWISYEEREDDYLFSVKDNGIGIEKKHHLKIFDIFQRLHTQDEYPGTGAGLTICKKIIDSFGGEIWIESKLGKGSTFYFTIPKEQTEEVESQPQTDQQVTQIQNGMQIQTE